MPSISAMRREWMLAGTSVAFSRLGSMFGFAPFSDINSRLVSATDPMRHPLSCLWGPHEARIDESAMEGQDLGVRLTPKISPLASHHQPLAFSLRR